MRLIGWALAAALFLSPVIISGLLVLERQQVTCSLAEEEAGMC